VYSTASPSLRLWQPSEQWGPPPPLRHRSALAPLLPDPQQKPGGGGAVSAAAAGGGGGTTLGAEGEEALTSKGWVKTRRHDKQINGKKGLHSLGALDLPATLEAGRPLLLLLLVPLWEIAPGW
jgi:hypothetical protein